LRRERTLLYWRSARMSEANPEESAIPKKGLKRRRPNSDSVWSGFYNLRKLNLPLKEQRLELSKPGAILFKLSHDGLMPKAARIDPEPGCFRGYCAEARR
jgi:hypothetical protein